MLKLRSPKFIIAAALAGCMAALLVYLLCWTHGWNPAWAEVVNPQSPVIAGNAAVPQSPAVSFDAASGDATPNRVERGNAGQNGAGDENSAGVEPQPGQISGQADGSVGQQPAQPFDQPLGQHADRAAEQTPDIPQDLAQDHGQSHAPGVAADGAPNQPASHASGQPHDAASAPDASTAGQQAGQKAAQPAIPQPDQTGGSKAAPAAPTAPTAQAATAHDTKIQLFGTVEFKRPLSTLPGWLDLLKRNRMDPVFVPGKVFKKGVTWDNFKAKAPLSNKMALLRYVNSFWNTWPYVEDIVNWGQEDYWEIPAEFLKKSGDCEDYSIIKYFTLKELGIAPENMRIVVVRDTIRNFAHAVLVVYLDDDAFVLDNLSNSVLSHTKVRQYSPQYSVNEFGRWAHLKGRKIE